MKKDFSKQLRKFASALERIDTEKIYLEAVKETEDLALDLNRVQMYELGIDAAGKPLGQYKDGTKRSKARKGQETSHITLRDRGEFQNEMFLDADQIPIFIDSNSSATEHIKRRWPNALGLTKEFGEQYKEQTMKVFRGKVNKKIEDAKSKISQ